MGQAFAGKRGKEFLPPAVDFLIVFCFANTVQTSGGMRASCYSAAT